MGQCLLKSVTVSIRNCLDLDKSAWFFPARGGNDGPIILKLLMQSTTYGIQTTKDTLHSLTFASYDYNFTEMLLARRNLIDKLAQKICSGYIQSFRNGQKQGFSSLARWQKDTR